MNFSGPDSIVIESGIPIYERPAREWNQFGRGYADVFRQLEIGDSFLCLDEMRGMCYMIARSIRIKLSIRKDAPGIVRVWRTE